MVGERDARGGEGGARHGVVARVVRGLTLEQQDRRARLARGRRGDEAAEVARRLRELPELEIDLGLAQPGEPARRAHGLGALGQVVLRARVVEVALDAARLAVQEQDPGAHGGREGRAEQLLDDRLRLGASLALDGRARPRTRRAGGAPGGGPARGAPPARPPPRRDGPAHSSPARDRVAPTAPSSPAPGPRGAERRRRERGWRRRGGARSRRFRAWPSDRSRSPSARSARPDGTTGPRARPVRAANTSRRASSVPRARGPCPRRCAPPARAPSPHPRTRPWRCARDRTPGPTRRRRRTRPCTRAVPGARAWG